MDKVTVVVGSLVAGALAAGVSYGIEEVAYRAYFEPRQKKRISESYEILNQIKAARQTASQGQGA